MIYEWNLAMLVAYNTLRCVANSGRYNEYYPLFVKLYPGIGVDADGNLTLNEIPFHNLTVADCESDGEYEDRQFAKLQSTDVLQGRGLEDLLPLVKQQEALASEPVIVCMLGEFLFALEHCEEYHEIST